MACIDGLMQDSSISIANTLEILQSCIKSSLLCIDDEAVIIFEVVIIFTQNKIGIDMYCCNVL